MKYFSTFFVLTFLLMVNGCKKEPLKNPVSMSPELSEVEGKVLVKFKTNLPQGMELMLTLSDKDEKLSIGQSKATVDSDGILTFEPIGPKEGLKYGQYKITVTSGLAVLQPNSVQQVIGQKGEYLSGQFVSEGETGEKFVYTYYPLNIYKKNGESGSTIQDKLKEFDKLANDAISKIEPIIQTGYNMNRGTTECTVTMNKLKGELNTISKQLETLPIKYVLVKSLPSYTHNCISCVPQDNSDCDLANKTLKEAKISLKEN